MSILSDTFLLTVCGSRAYGMATSESDLGVKGVMMLPRSRYFDPLTPQTEQIDDRVKVREALETLAETDSHLSAMISNPVEGTVYELRKFIQLASAGNPNILDVLFCREEEVILSSAAGARLRENAGLFVTARVRHAFSGYAFSQLKRIKTHRGWLINPPKGKPSREEYGLPEVASIPEDQLAAANALVQKQLDSWEIDFQSVEEPERIQVLSNVEKMLTEVIGSSDKWASAARTVGLSDNVIHTMQQERAYQNASLHYKQYRHWKVSRNPLRSELEAQHGYDTKHASHLVRLLLMGKEILLTGKVNVWREDHDELLAIRRGAWDYDRLLQWAEDQEAEITRIYKNREYVVPDNPDRAAITKLALSIYEEELRDA